MFRFFTKRKWLAWSWGGVVFIILATWYQVHLSALINEWFGVFYDLLQDVMVNPNNHEIGELYAVLFDFSTLAGMWIATMVVLSFFVSHWTFRWRTSITEYYVTVLDKAYGLEGCDQRLQDDAFRFTRMVETLGSGILDSILTLIVFLPILWRLSERIIEIPIFGRVDHSLVVVAVIMAFGGTVVMAWFGRKLPGNEYRIQAAEAAFRRELVLHDEERRKPEVGRLKGLYEKVTARHFLNFWLYFKFNIFKYAYLQGMVVVPYLVLSPSILSGTLTLGIVQQIVRAFNQVETSLQYLIRSWNLIVEFVSVYKRLREFERTIEQ